VDQLDSILTRLENGIFTITLNRPHVLNAMTVEMFYGLAAAIEEAERNPEAEIVHLRGAGGHFCSGADLSVLQSIANPVDADKALTVINGFLTRLHHLPKPVIAVLDGVAVGAGLNLALHADFVLAAEDAVLQEPFVHIGLTTDFGGTYLLPRLVGLAQAKRLAMLGEKISGKEAAQIGLICKAVPLDQLEAEVAGLTESLRRLPRAALVKTKEGMTRSLEMSPEQSLAWEKAAQPDLIVQPAFQERVRAKMRRHNG